MNEAQLSEFVRAMAAEKRALCAHFPDSRAQVGAPGFPDYVILGPHGLLFRELKSDRGNLTEDQYGWGFQLIRAGASWRVWRPADAASGLIRAEITAAVKGK